MWPQVLMDTEPADDPEARCDWCGTAVSHDYDPPVCGAPHCVASERADRAGLL